MENKKFNTIDGKVVVRGFKITIILKFFKKYLFIYQ